MDVDSKRLLDSARNNAFVMGDFHNPKFCPKSKKNPKMLS